VPHWSSRRRKMIPSLAQIPSASMISATTNMDPHGYACPFGAHIRHMNPRDTAVNMQRRKMIRRGGTYGPPLPEGAPEDGKERGIAAFIGCASPVRRFEFAMNVWANDPNFHELGNQRDPIDLDRPHPFTAAGNSEFNSCIWDAPEGRRSRTYLLADSTIFTTLFGGTDSLEMFWKNIARM
jgi:hypothetical protein